MRMSNEEKSKSHARIVASASRLFRERGLEGASVADVMQDAAMTHGGFYKHFTNKGALVEAALDEAFSKFVASVEKDESQSALDLYLSRGHLSNPGMGCPVATLGPEVARGPNPLKAVFGAGVRRMVDAIAHRRAGPDDTRRRKALREFSMLVGAVIIARASDPELADDVLAACRGEPDHVH